MKRLFIKAALIVSTAIFATACNNDEDAPDNNNMVAEITETDTDLATTDAAMDIEYNVIEDEVDGIVATAFAENNGRIATEVTGCRTVSKEISWDRENKVYTKSATIDFGDGCEESNRNRSGKIMAVYQSSKEEKEVDGIRGTLTITLENYTVDGVTVSGTRTRTFLKQTEEQKTAGIAEFKVTLTDGQITLEDGTVISRNASWDVTKQRSEGKLVSKTFSGTTSGVNQKGVNYSTEVTTPIVIQRVCDTYFRMPVSGEKTITTDNKTMTINYGEGECDDIADVTLEGEEGTETKQKTIRVGRGYWKTRKFKNNSANQ